jgi:N-acetylglucosaminylphosphatidylinositol deacetylase
MAALGIKGAALLVIAHPDDESMFFLPTIKNLLSNGVKLHLLCLSSGDADGLGHVRKDELIKATRLLGFEEGSAEVIEDSALKDGMQEVWDPLVVAKRVSTCVEKNNIDVVSTTVFYPRQ